MPPTFSYKLTKTNIYGHLLYRIHKKDAVVIDGANLLRVLKKATRVANNYLQHTDCNILVFADPDKTIPEEGLGGLSWGNDWIRIDIDPNTKLGVTKAIQTYLPGMLAHELHHARRSGSVGYGETLSEMLVTEGLAQAYQEFLYPNVDVMYAHYLTAAEIGKAWITAQAELNSKEYNHLKWFYGTGKLKRWAGYSLGYDIVQKYLTRNSEMTPASLVDIPAQVLLQDY